MPFNSVTPSLPPHIEECSLIMLKTSWEINTKLQGLLSPHHLTFAMFFAIGYMDAVGRPVSPQELTALAQGHEDFTVAILTQLESNQFITKQYDLRNGMKLMLTNKAQQTLEKIIPDWCLIVKHYWSGISDSECIELTRILKKMNQLNYAAPSAAAKRATDIEA